MKNAKSPSLAFHGDGDGARLADMPFFLNRPADAFQVSRLLKKVRLTRHRRAFGLSRRQRRKILFISFKRGMRAVKDMRTRVSKAVLLD